MTRASEWAQDYLRAHPEVVLVRLGHGYDPDAGASFAWADTITAGGEHREVTPPADVRTNILDTNPVEHWLDITRTEP
jgi:hypothetical protein